MFTCSCAYMLLFLVLAVNSNQIQILRSYTLLLKPPILMHSCVWKGYGSLVPRLLVGGEKKEPIESLGTRLGIWYHCDITNQLASEDQSFVVSSVA